MSNTHKIHSQASADAALSIIRPAGGLTRLPRPEGCRTGNGLAGPERVQVNSIGVFHTCPQVVGT